MASSFAWLLIRQTNIGSSSAGSGVPWNIISGSHQRSSGLLQQLALVVCTGHEREDHVAAVEDVERLLPADLLHDPRVRGVRALEQRLLGDDRRCVDEPRDHADVAPGVGRVVEDVVELRLSGHEVVQTGVARLAEVLDDAVDQLRVPDLVLDLRRERELALQGRARGGSSRARAARPSAPSWRASRRT